MSDGMDDLKDLIRHRQGQRQIGATNQVVSELQRQNEILQRQNQALQPKGPPCPFCGGDLPMRNAEVCKHCRKDLAWVQGVPCKPGQERQLRAKLEEQQKRKAERDAKLAKTLPTARAKYQRLTKAKEKNFTVNIVLLPVWLVGMFISLVWMMIDPGWFTYVLALFAGAGVPILAIIYKEIYGFAFLESDAEELSKLIEKYGHDRLNS